MPSVISLIVILLIFILLSFVFYFFSLFIRNRFSSTALNTKKKVRDLINDLNDEKFPRLIKNINESNFSLKDNYLYNFLRNLILTSGSKQSVQNIISQIFIYFILCFVILKLLNISLVISFLLTFITCLLPIINLVYRRNKRFIKFESQLPDALDFISRALEAGHSLTYAMQGLSQEMSEPLSTEFKILSDQINFGRGLDEALTDMTNRIKIPDLNFFVISLLIQKDSGGNLSDILKSISSTIRERLKLKGKVNIFSSEARLSAIILIAMPFVVAIILYFANPKYISLLWTTSSGLYLISIACIMIPIGTYWMYKITDIKV